MKVSSKIYKGIEYIQLNELPNEQKEKFAQCLGEDTLIKIKIDETVVSNCIQYKDYELWFDNVFRNVVPPVRIERLPEPASIAMAVGKI